MGGSGVVGRDAELAQLDNALAEAAGHGSALFVTGAAGIGKTCRLNVVTSDARRRGYKVLTVTGLESEVDLPFAGCTSLSNPSFRQPARFPVHRKTRCSPQWEYAPVRRLNCFLSAWPRSASWTRSPKKGLSSWLRMTFNGWTVPPRPS